jgi:hypothetical protein
MEGVGDKVAKIAAVEVPQAAGDVEGAGGAVAKIVAPEVTQAAGDVEDAGVQDPPPGSAKTKVDPPPPPFNFEEVSEGLYAYLKQYILGSTVAWELTSLRLGINLGLGGRSIHAGNQEKLHQGLLTSCWAPQHSIIVVTSEMDGETFVVDGNHRVSALKRMTSTQEQRVLGGTTVKCVVYEGVSANLIAILALHVNDENLRGNGTTK